MMPGRCRAARWLLRAFEDAVLSSAGRNLDKLRTEFCLEVLQLCDFLADPARAQQLLAATSGVDILEMLYDIQKPSSLLLRGRVSLFFCHFRTQSEEEIVDRLQSPADMCGELCSSCFHFVFIKGQYPFPQVSGCPLEVHNQSTLSTQQAATSRLGAWAP